MDGRCVDGLRISVSRAQKIAERRAEFARERTNLYVRNLPTDMGDVELERLFGRFREIVRAKVPNQANNKFLNSIIKRLDEESRKA